MAGGGWQWGEPLTSVEQIAPSPSERLHTARSNLYVSVVLFVPISLMHIKSIYGYPYYFLLGAMITSPIAFIFFLMMKTGLELEAGLIKTGKEEQKNEGQTYSETKKELMYKTMRQRGIWPWGALIAVIGYIAYLSLTTIINSNASDMVVQEIDAADPCSQKVEAIRSGLYEPAGQILMDRIDAMTDASFVTVIFLSMALAHFSVLRRLKAEGSAANQEVEVGNDG